MAKGVNIVSFKAKFSCITRVSYHYHTFNLDAFIDILLITVHSNGTGQKLLTFQMFLLHDQYLFVPHCIESNLC